MARRTYLDRDGLCRRVVESWHNTAHFRRLSSEATAHLIELVFATDDWSRMTRMDQHYILGYERALRQHVIDPQIESGNWFTMPDGTVHYRAAFDGLPEGISHEYIYNNRIQERSGLFWHTPSAPGRWPFFLTEERARKSDGSED